MMKTTAIAMSLTAAAIAAPTTCPNEVVKTSTASGVTWTNTAVSTVFEGETHTLTEPNYTSTETLSNDEITTEYTYQSTGTVTVVATETSVQCTQTATSNMEFTSTVYEGSYTSSPLSAICTPSTRTTYVYPSTVTVTDTVTYPLVATITTPAVSTSTAYRETSTIVVPIDDVATTIGSTSTLTIPGWCTSTITTATAPAAATYAAKCPPDNLLVGSDPISLSGEPDEEYDASHPSNKDASACCQACVDAEDCAASWFREYRGDNYCGLYKGEDGLGKCGVAYALESVETSSDNKGARGQVGCGSIVRRL